VQQDPQTPQRIYMPWGERRSGELRITHHGAGKPWVTLQSLAAVPRKEAFNAGYAVRKTITPVQQAEGVAAGKYQRGDVLRVRLEVEAGDRHDLGGAERPHPRRGHDPGRRPGP
jgi:hypothetical protein